MTGSCHTRIVSTFAPAPRTFHSSRCNTPARPDKRSDRKAPRRPRRSPPEPPSRSEERSARRHLAQQKRQRRRSLRVLRPQGRTRSRSERSVQATACSSAGSAPASWRRRSRADSHWASVGLPAEEVGRRPRRLRARSSPCVAPARPESHARWAHTRRCSRRGCAR